MGVTVTDRSDVTVAPVADQRNEAEISPQKMPETSNASIQR